MGVGACQMFTASKRGVWRKELYNVGGGGLGRVGKSTTSFEIVLKLGPF